jgi:hypothetical protein
MEGVMLLFLLACQVPEAENEPYCIRSLGCGEEPDEPNIDPAKACHDGDELLVESGYDGPGTHFAWTAEESFIAAGGSIPDVDAPSVVLQCPPCSVLGTQFYELRIEFTDEDADVVGWGFGRIAQVCENE